MYTFFTHQMVPLFPFSRSPDSDSDGLSDYEEISLIGTDPLLANTDDNGVLDADEDSDLDGLTNIEEIKLGTNPSSADSDIDTLTDYDEVNCFFTNPCLADLSSFL